MNRNKENVCVARGSDQVVHGGILFLKNKDITNQYKYHLSTLTKTKEGENLFLVL